MGLNVGSCKGAYNCFRNESAQWVKRFGKWQETAPVPTPVWKNAHKMENFDTFTRNILNDVKDYKLRSKLIEIQEKVNKLIKDGRFTKDGPEYKSLQETIALSSHLDPANDRLVCDAIAERLEEAVRYAKFNDVVHRFENVEQLAGIPVHSNAAAFPLHGRVNEMHNFFKKNSYSNNLLNKPELEEAYKTQELVNFLTGETVPPAISVPASSDLDKYLYKKYYLSRQKSDVQHNLGIIEENFGTKTFVPPSATDAETDDLLREFYAWNAVGAKKLITKMCWITLTSMSNYTGTICLKAVQEDMLLSATIL